MLLQNRKVNHTKTNAGDIKYLSFAGNLSEVRVTSAQCG